MADVNTPDAIPATNASNTTRYFHLPLFISTDKPSWLVDWNGAMMELDNILQNIETASEGAVADVSTIQTQIDAINQLMPTLEATVQTAVEDVAAMQTTVNSHETRMDSIEADLITQNNLIKTLSDSVVSMQATVTSLNNRVASMESSLSTMGTNVDALNTAISGIRSDVSSLSSRVSALEQGESGGAGISTGMTFVSSSATISGRGRVYGFTDLDPDECRECHILYGSSTSISLAYLPQGSTDPITSDNAFLVDSTGNPGSTMVTFKGPGELFADGAGMVTIRFGF